MQELGDPRATTPNSEIQNSNLQKFRIYFCSKKMNSNNKELRHGSFQQGQALDIQSN
jgi:hypothetical protein